MRVGIIGLGSIAQKAYLPVLTGLAGVTPVLVTRNPGTLATVGAAYRAPTGSAPSRRRSARVSDAALVHTPSATHPAIVTTLLGSGVPVWSSGRWPPTT